MKRTFAAQAILTFSCAVAGWAQGPTVGVPPRAKPDDYAAKAQTGSTIFAASLIPAKQVKHLFAFDISPTYLVFEVACYPDSSKAIKIEREDFVVKGRTQGELTHHADAETVAAVIQRQNVPKPPSTKPDVGGAVAVGYESGTDPVTGRRVHGTYTDASVGVGLGNDRGPSFPSPGGLPQDRDLLQAQLKARSLPEGRQDHAVAGYLFFPRAGLKADTNGKYALTYLMDANAAGRANEVVLSVAEKTH